MGRGPGGDAVRGDILPPHLMTCRLVGIVMMFPHQDLPRADCWEELALRTGGCICPMVGGGCSVVLDDGRLVEATEVKEERPGEPDPRPRALLLASGERHLCFLKGLRGLPV